MLVALVCLRVGSDSVVSWHFLIFLCIIMGVIWSARPVKMNGVGKRCWRVPDYAIAYWKTFSCFRSKLILQDLVHSATLIATNVCERFTSLCWEMMDQNRSNRFVYLPTAISIEKSVKQVLWTVPFHSWYRHTQVLWKAACFTGPSISLSLNCFINFSLKIKLFCNNYKNF